MRHHQKSAALLLSAALLFTSGALFGCNNDSVTPDNGTNSVAGEQVYYPRVPKNPIAEDAAGENTNSKLGETVNYKDKLSVSLDKVIALDSKSGTGGIAFIAEMTITNNSTESIDCSTGTHFSTIIDGEEDFHPVINVSPAIFARQYYAAINQSDFVSFNQEIKAGETVKGYVTFKTPEKYDELKLVYIPYKYYSNDKVIFSIDEASITHFSQPLNAGDSSAAQ